MCTQSDCFRNTRKIQIVLGERPFIYLPVHIFFIIVFCVVILRYIFKSISHAMYTGNVMKLFLPSLFFPSLIFEYYYVSAFQRSPLSSGSMMEQRRSCCTSKQQQQQISIHTSTTRNNEGRCGEEHDINNRYYCGSSLLFGTGNIDDGDNNTDGNDDKQFKYIVVKDDKTTGVADSDAKISDDDCDTDGNTDDDNTPVDDLPMFSLSYNPDQVNLPMPAFTSAVVFFGSTAFTIYLYYVGLTAEGPYRPPIL